jgi:hypothetical protein
MALAKKLNVSTGGTAAPARKPGRSTPRTSPATPPKMQSGGTLTTGEHPERQAYLKKTGRTKDPLEASGGQVQRSFVNNQAGPRKGMTATEILKGGAKYHVYYGPGGTRSVYRVPTRASAGLAARRGMTGASANRI